MNIADYTAYHPLFSRYGMNPAAIHELIVRWRETHRHYHNESHLKFLLQAIEKLHVRQQITEDQRDSLLMTAFFHDVVYDPVSQQNEEESARLFSELTQPLADSDQIVQMILDTKTHAPQSELSGIFSGLDMAVVSNSDFEALLAWEKGIAKEYQFVDYSLYKTGRTTFLEGCIQAFPQNKANLQNLLAYLNQYKPRIGIYAGSFNPFHNGHLNILEKAEKIFDKVIVARGINPEKDIEPKTSRPTGVLKYRQVENFAGLLTDYIASKEEHTQVTLVRGLRNGDDLSYEVNQLRFMEDMKPDLKVVFIRCDMQFEHISSSAIRNLEKISRGLGSKYVPVE